MRSTYLFLYFLLFIIISGVFSCKSKSNINSENKLISTISQKYKFAITSYSHISGNPRNVEANNKAKFVESSDWTSGFYPGCLWFVFELTSDTIFKNEAIIHTEILEQEKYNSLTHDMGFKLYCSYGNGYRLSHNNKYKDILLQGAKTLITRYNPRIGCIRSWDHHTHLWKYPVIIDNMMNLELLFFAFRETGDSTYYNIAVSHADKTMENHFRHDYSCYHVVNYDSITGKVISKNTHQGYSDESAWARGQAWALYGFTLMFRETKDSKYLTQAEGIANFILNNPTLPDDMIPYWDFNAPNIPNEPRDASAAAIISSALFELSTYSNDKNAEYLNSANQILEMLSSDKYFAGIDAKHHFLLEHSTGNWPKKTEVDEPIIYADYYFLEALLRKIKLLEK